MDELTVEYIDVITSAPKLPAKMMRFFPTLKSVSDLEETEERL